MKTDVYRFEKDAARLGEINDVVSKIAVYNGLGKKQELELNLLSEELVEMMPNLLRYGEGSFWIENAGSSYEIHAVVEPETLLPSEERARVMSVSSSGKNAAAVGIMNRIKEAAETLMANYAVTVGTSGTSADEHDRSLHKMGGYAYAAGTGEGWSLENYRRSAKGDEEAWDELEKSIIANLADDVTVGILGGRVEITIKKKF